MKKTKTVTSATPFISEDELTKSSPVPIKTRDLIGRLQDYNFDAIYQRGSDIWSMKMKKDLIISMICGVPVGYIHVIRHPENAEYWAVCDGKQRWTTLNDFIKGHFSFEYMGKSLSYNDLRQPEYKDVYSKFISYVWDVREWPPMSILKQRDLFERINAMSSLNNHERLYCINFFAKSVLLHTHNILRISLQNKMTAPIEKNKRFAGLSWAHDLLHTCFGHDFRGSYSLTHPSAKLKKISAQYVNDIFQQHFGGVNGVKQDDLNGNIITQEVLNKVGMLENVELLEKTAGCIKTCLSYGDMIKQKMDQNAIKDILIWTLNHLRDKTLTVSQIKEQKSKFFKLFKAFNETRHLRLLTQKQTSKSTKKATFEYLDLLSDSLEINTEEKGIPLSEADKLRALSKSNGVCPICACKLTEQNMHFDHVLCKSKHNRSVACCLCSDCNIRKSNWTSDELAKHADYIAEYTKERI